MLWLYIIGWLIVGLLSVIYLIYDENKGKDEITCTVEEVFWILGFILFGFVSFIIILLFILSKNKDKIILTIEKRKKK